jgi:Asparagine synthase (glutamine-hydrolyzing)
MISIDLTYNKGYKWFGKEYRLFVKGFIFDKEEHLLRGEDLLNYFSAIDSFDEFKNKLSEANGIYSVIIQKENSIWAAIDPARNFPLFYYQDEKNFYITDNPDTFRKHNIPFEIDKDSEIIFTYSGFTSKHKTLLKNISQLVAGECILVQDNKVKHEFHTQFLTNTFTNKTRTELKEELKKALDGVGKRMVQVLDNRPVAIPLSGGYDSRLVAYLLRKNNYSNVICFTYGFNDCIELDNARKTADNLNYEFYLSDYEKQKEIKLSEDSLYLEYVDFATNYSFRLEDQDYFAVKELKEINKLSPDTIFIPGHSGAIAGHLLSQDMGNDDFSFVNHALTNVFSLVYPQKKELKIIEKEIRFLDEKQSAYPPYLVYENWRYQTTTALAFNSSRIWEFFGFEYLIPLWDKALYNFFMQVPLEHKYDKNLFKETLSELFEEYSISFLKQEIEPSKRTIKRVALNHKIKNAFPFLKRFVNPDKLDTIGARYYLSTLIKELKDSGSYRKYLNLNGVLSAWYIMKLKEKLRKK